MLKRINTRTQNDKIWTYVIADSNSETAYRYL